MKKKSKNCPNVMQPQPQPAVGGEEMHQQVAPSRHKPPFGEVTHPALPGLGGQDQQGGQKVAADPDTGAQPHPAPASPEKKQETLDAAKTNSSNVSPVAAPIAMNSETALRTLLAFRAEMLTLSQVQKDLNVKRGKLYGLRNAKNDPLPEHDMDGSPRVNRGELEDWKSRRKNQSSR
jgi:hypothetical protein